MKKIFYIVCFLFSLCASAQTHNVKSVDYKEMTTTEMNAFVEATEGEHIFNTTTKTPWYFNGSTWVEISGGGSATTDASDLTSGVLADARVQESNVTQHEGALTITENQISNLSHTTDTNLSDAEVKTAIDNEYPNLDTDSTDDAELDEVNNFTNTNYFSHITSTSSYIDFTSPSTSNTMRLQNFLTDDFFFTPTGSSPETFGYDFNTEKWNIDGNNVLTTNSDLTGITGNTDDQEASEVAFTPNGSISAADVQAAIQEVRDEAVIANSGIVAEGEFTISSAGDNVVTHGLGYTPSLSRVSIVKLNGLTTTAPNYFIDNITSTQMTINITNISNDVTIGWAIYGTGTIVGQTASEVSYDNTTSALTATNVQDAIDELEDEIDGVGSGTAIGTKVADYTALSAISSPSTGDLAIVTDEATGGVFVYDATLSATDDGGVVIDGWVRQYEGWINYLWFGGINTWDTATQGSSTDSGVLAAFDNRVAWNLANTYASSVEGTLYFPPGEYMFNANNGYLNIYSNVTYQGDKNTIFTIPAIADGSLMVFWANGVSNFTIRDIIFDGNWTNVPGDDADGVGNLRITDSSDILLENVTSRNTWYLGLSIVNSSRGVVRNYNGRNTDCGIITQGGNTMNVEDWLFDGGIIDGHSASEGIILFDSNHKNITIQNFTIRNKTAGTAIAVGRLDRPTEVHDNIKVLNNVMDNMASGISFAGGINTNGVISGNTVTNMTGADGIDATTSYNLVISGNTVNGVPQNAYEITDSDGVTITNNYGINPFNDAVSFGNSYGYFLIDGSSRVEMTSNDFYTDHATIQKSGRILDSDYVTFKNNDIYTTNGAPDQTVYINEGATVNADAVTNSYIETDYPRYTVWNEHVPLYDGSVDNTNVIYDRGDRLRNLTISGGDLQIANHTAGYNNYEVTITDGALENFANKKTGQEVNLRATITTTPLVLTNSGNIAFADTATIPTGETVQFRLISEGSTWREISRSYGSGGTDDQIASEVNIADSGDYFTATDVEAMGQEIAASLAAMVSSDITGRTNGASIDNIIEQPYADVVSDGVPNSGTYIFSPDAPPAELFTGTEIPLTGYKQQDNTATDTATWTLGSDVRNGASFDILINQASEPAITGATQIPGTAAFSANTLSVIKGTVILGTTYYYYLALE